MLKVQTSRCGSETSFKAYLRLGDAGRKRLLRPFQTEILEEAPRKASCHLRMHGIAVDAQIGAIPCGRIIAMRTRSLQGGSVCINSITVVVIGSLSYSLASSSSVASSSSSPSASS